MFRMSKDNQPFWVRHADKATMLCYGFAYLAGGGIILYQAAIWFIYTEFNYMSVDWFLNAVNAPFFSDAGSWYNRPEKWVESQKYLKLVLEWFPTSVAAFLLGNFLGGGIDNAVNNWHRSSIVRGDRFENA